MSALRGVARGARVSEFIPFDWEKQSDSGIEAAAIEVLVDVGFTPQSIATAILEDDWTLLEHSGEVAVQL